MNSPNQTHDALREAVDKAYEKYQEDWNRAYDTNKDATAKGHQPPGGYPSFIDRLLIAIAPFLETEDMKARNAELVGQRDTAEAEIVEQANGYAATIADLSSQLASARAELADAKTRESTARAGKEQWENAHKQLNQNAAVRRTALRAQVEEAMAACKNYQAMLHRIAKEGFDLDDTISLEPYDEYILRQVRKLRAQLAARSAAKEAT